MRTGERAQAKTAAGAGAADGSAERPFDIVVIGGGVNGCGVARDAAGRGFSVFLAEADDLASGTSSWSTKLIHGGLRYLEHYEFRLVRESLEEREVLWANAPHIIRPLRFVLPYHAGLRPKWLLRLGLFLYDHLGGRRRLPPTRTVDLRTDPIGGPLRTEFTTGFEYSDCWVDDARLVVLNARSAADLGAVIATRSEVVGAERTAGGAAWSVAVRDRGSGARRNVHGHLLVNAAGPWIDSVVAAVTGRNDVHNVRLVQGSHIVVPRLYAHDRSYIFQNADGRILFAIPYEDDFTLLGTTDQDYVGDPRAVAISDGEIDYICAAASAYFREPVLRERIVWTYSGVRPLYDDGASKAQEATRDYVLKEDGGPGPGTMINIFGGKLTTYRRLSEAVLERIEAALGARAPAWTREAPLPGGDFPVEGFADLVGRLRTDYTFLGERHAARLVRLYGTDAWILLGDARSGADLGEAFGADLTEREVRFLVEHEWAETADDVLWRRTKMGLLLSRAEQDGLAAFLDRLEDRGDGVRRAGTGGAAR